MMNVDEQKQADSVEQDERVLLNVTGRVDELKLFGYIEHRFQVPDAPSEIRAYLTYEESALFLTLFGPGGYRGTVMKPDSGGRVTLDAVCASESASPGIVAGTIEPGEWRAVIDYGPMVRPTEYQLVVLCRTGESSRRIAPAVPTAHELHHEPGWYRGELHAHSAESDGRKPAATVAAAAETAELDFISLTDHWTVSGWHHMRRALSGNTLLIRGCEITSRRGHANVHGIGQPLDPCVDGPGWTMNNLADAVHEQGGVFCVNHAFSGALGWRTEEFDWNKADAMEVIHGQEGPGNNLQLSLWDHHLRLGRRIVGVAGTDSHYPTEGTHRLGRLVNWVYSEALTERAVIEGIMRGRVVASFGPFAELTIEAGDRKAAMGETLSVVHNGVHELTLTVNMRLSEPVRVFVLKNGMPLESTWVSPDEYGAASYGLTDAPMAPCYYRVELHSAAPDSKQSGGSSRRTLIQRDYRSLLAVTNPVFTEQVP